MNENYLIVSLHDDSWLALKRLKKIKLFDRNA